MTDNRAQPFWVRSPSAYVQQDVVQPATGQNPDNARLAVHHFAKPVPTEYYSDNAEWRTGRADVIDDGRNDHGAETVIAGWVVTYPGTSGEQSPLAPEAQHEEGVRTFVLDSNMPENRALAAANPGIFPDGHLYIAGPDADGLEQSNNFPTVFRWGGNRWKVTAVILWNGGRNEEEHDTGGIYEATTTLYRDRSHERDAQRGLPHRDETPGIADDVYDGWQT